MTILEAGAARFAPKLVVFDKDGTLIDFHHLWGGKARAAVAALGEAMALSPAGIAALRSTLGYDHEHVAGDGPMASATNDEVVAVAAAVLYQLGIPWPRALQAVKTHFLPIIVAPAPVKPLADARPLCQALRHGGVRIGVITNDIRAMTVANLAELGLMDLVDGLVCGDDGLPSKPAPAMLQKLLTEFGLAPAAAVVIGDSASDLMMAEVVGAGRIGVLSGNGTAAQLAPHADVIIPSIAELRVIAT